MHADNSIAFIVHGFGGGEDATVVALVQQHGWPVICLNPTTSRRVPNTISQVIWGPHEIFRGAHNASWLPAMLRLHGIRTAVCANYPRSVSDLIALRELLSPVNLVQVTHGLDDRARHSPFYPTFRVLGNYHLTLVDSPIWKQEVSRAVPGANVAAVGNIELSVWLAKRGSQFILPRKQKTVLYAPSWWDSERPDEVGNGWFERAGVEVCRNIPRDAFLRVRPHPSSLLNNSGFIAEVVDFLSRRGNAELVQSSPRSVLDDILDADVVISDHSSVSPFALWLDRPLIMYDETCLGAWSDFVQRAAVLVKNGRELSENVAKILCGVDQERLGREEFRARAVLFNPDVLKDICQAVEEVNRK